MTNLQAIEKVENALSALNIKDRFGEKVEPVILSGLILCEFDFLQKKNDEFGLGKISAKEWAGFWCAYIETYKRIMACKKLDKFASAL